MREQDFSNLGAPFVISLTPARGHVCQGCHFHEPLVINIGPLRQKKQDHLLLPSDSGYGQGRSSRTVSTRDQSGIIGEMLLHPRQIAFSSCSVDLDTFAMTYGGQQTNEDADGYRFLVLR